MSHSLTTVGMSFFNRRGGTSTPPRRLRRTLPPCPTIKPSVTYTSKVGAQSNSPPGFLFAAAGTGAGAVGSDEATEAPPPPLPLPRERPPPVAVPDSFVAGSGPNKPPSSSSSSPTSKRPRPLGLAAAAGFGGGGDMSSNSPAYFGFAADAGTGAGAGAGADAGAAAALVLAGLQARAASSGGYGAGAVAVAVAAPGSSSSFVALRKAVREDAREEGTIDFAFRRLGPRGRSSVEGARSGESSSDAGVHECVLSDEARATTGGLAGECILMCAKEAARALMDADAFAPPAERGGGGADGEGSPC